MSEVWEADLHWSKGGNSDSQKFPVGGLPNPAFQLEHLKNGLDKSPAYFLNTGQNLRFPLFTCSSLIDCISEVGATEASPICLVFHTRPFGWVAFYRMAYFRLG